MRTIAIIILLAAFSSAGNSQTTWHSQESGTNTVLFDVHFTDQDHGWLCGNTGLIMHSNNGGANWVEQDPPPVNTYYGIHFSDNQNGWACGYGGQIVHTTDGGNTWFEQAALSNTYLYDVIFINADTGWIVGGDNGTFPSLIRYREVLYTQNGGSTWIAQISETDKSPLSCVHFADMNTGYAAGESGAVLYTPDGGITWIEVMSDQSYEFMGVFALNDTTAFVSGVYLGLPHVSVIFKTTDNGTTWTSQTFAEDESLVDICFVDESNGWAVGGATSKGTILRTTDGGETWFNEDPGTDNYLFSVSFVDISHGWAVGQNGTVIATQIFTGIEDPVREISLKVFPNPATAYINIQMHDESVQATKIVLINTVGQIIIQEDIAVSSGFLDYKINTSGIKPGLYNLIVSSAAERITQKVIIR